MKSTIALRCGLLLSLAASACSDESEPATTSSSSTGGSEIGGGGSDAGAGGAGGAPDGGGAEGGAGGATGCVVAEPEGPLEVATTHGLVRGIDDGGVTAFLGLPYAAPPIGDNRFRAPQELACWDGVRDADELGSACVQDLPTGGAAGDEDCLYLNVWSPSTTGEKKPVLFFVHGGALLLGSGGQDLAFEGTGNLYSGQRIATERDAVVVTINYRLAELGFLAHPALAAEDENGSSGNYGMLDQIAALRWVHDNIERFGGDPDRVMLFGESAGGLSTCLLMSSPLTAGLFSSALVESGGCLVASKAGREGQGEAIADAVGCEDAEDVVRCLREQPVDDFRVPPPSGVSLFVFDDLQRTWEMPFGPNEDGYVFEEPPLVSIRNGGADVPFVVGSNGHEFELFIPPGTINTCPDYWALVGTLFGELADEIIGHYSCFDYLFPRWAAVDVGTDFMFTCPARRMARAALEGGAPSVHRYRYMHSYSNSPLTVVRSFHASELPFVFGTFDVFGYAPTDGDLALSSAMQGYWSRFAASGDPNGDGAFAWPAYDFSTETAIVFDDSLTTTDAIADERCDFWDTLATD